MRLFGFESGAELRVDIAPAEASRY